MSTLIPPPLSLYIHFPWCVKKCPYCDFNSHEYKSQFDEDLYVDCLLRDLEQDLPLIWGRTINSIFMGGGTPSLFSAQAMKKLMNGLRSLLSLRPDLEVTMELNPGAKEYDNFEEYLEAGINRLSMGFQSLDDLQLKKLGRIHSSKQAIQAYQKARKAGFRNINLDLMFALPGQTLSQAQKELEKLALLDPEHISYYQLTLEPNTLFHHRPPKDLPEMNLKDEMYHQGREYLEKQDYTQYEVSAFSNKGLECFHNINYWKFGDYLGIGAGAHGKISFGHDERIIRYLKHKLPRKYLSAEIFIQEENVLDSSSLYFEFMLNAVRLKMPITKNHFEQSTGLEFSELLILLAEPFEEGLVSLDGQRIELTEIGFLLSDEILKKLL